MALNVQSFSPSVANQKGFKENKKNTYFINLKNTVKRAQSVWQYAHSPCKRRDHPFNHLYFIRTKDTTMRPSCPCAQQCKKKKKKKYLLCCETVFICLCYFYLWFPCELTGKHASAASLEMLNLDMRKTNNICLLSKKKKLKPKCCHGGHAGWTVRCLYYTIIPTMKKF